MLQRSTITNTKDLTGNLRYSIPPYSGSERYPGIVAEVGGGAVSIWAERAVPRRSPSVGRSAAVCVRRVWLMAAIPVSPWRRRRWEGRQ
jgi:hypothetical protein